MRRCLTGGRPRIVSILGIVAGTAVTTCTARSCSGLVGCGHATARTGLGRPGRQPGIDFHAVTLINNAGVLAPLRPAADTDPAALIQALRVGLEAPLLLAAAPLRVTRDWPARQHGGVRVLNISSGPGRRGMAGSAAHCAAYCAAKAGLDNGSRALALEETTGPWPARIVSLAPGVIDTAMQVELRGADPAAFPEHARFVDLQRQQQLSSPDDAAQAAPAPHHTLDPQLCRCPLPAAQPGPAVGQRVDAWLRRSSPTCWA